MRGNSGFCVQQSRRKWRRDYLFRRPPRDRPRGELPRNSDRLWGRRCVRVCMFESTMNPITSSQDGIARCAAVIARELRDDDSSSSKPSKSESSSEESSSPPERSSSSAPRSSNPAFRSSAPADSCTSGSDDWLSRGEPPRRPRPPRRRRRDRPRLRSVCSLSSSAAARSALD